MTRSTPLRLLIPVLLALLSVALTLFGVAYDRYASYRDIETSTARRAASLSHIVVPTLERAMLEGDTPAVADALARIALEPNVVLALVIDGQDVVVEATDRVQRGRSLSSLTASGVAALVERARLSKSALTEFNPGRGRVRVATPFLEANLPGELRPSRVAVLYTETDLMAPKAGLFRAVAQRAALLGSVALLACVLVWASLRWTFTAELDRFVASVAAFADGRTELQVPTGGSWELAQIGATMSKLLTDLRAEHGRLRESEGKFWAVFENAPVAIGLSEVGSCDVIEVNGEATRMTRCAREDLVGKSPAGAGWLGSDDQARLLAALGEDGRVNGLDLQVHATGGALLDCTCFAERVTIAGAPMLLWILQDLTDHRRAERQLRASEARFRAIVENSHDGIIFTDEKGTILYRSPYYDVINGYSNEERSGRSGFETIHPDEAPALHDAWARMLASADGFLQAEFRIRHKDGSWRWIDTSARNLLRNPSVGAIIVTSRDITERKKAESEREILQAQLAQSRKIEAVGRLAGGVAHDFNNMLGVILGFAEMALDATPAEHPAHQDLLEVLKASDRAGRLTRQLLAFARQQPAEPKVVDLNESVEDTLAMLRRLIGENITLTWQPGHGIALVNIDPVQVDQILANLCVNARDAIAGVGTVSIDTANVRLGPEFCALRPGARPGDYVRLNVRDSGSGMTPDVMEHIFEPFFTTKAMGKGTGLGLATVYGIVTQNGGFIDVASRPGDGTLFSVFLPADELGADDATVHTAPSPHEHGKATVLLVEDEPSVLMLTTRVLERLGYEVRPAATPHAAIDVARANPGRIDLLMTDVIMPEMNGRQLANVIHQLWPNAGCLFTSGYSADLIAEYGVFDDGHEFLRKPWTKEELAAKVTAVLSRA